MNKKYFLHNGTEQNGPYDIEELKAKNIGKQTSVWCEGMSNWTNAENIEELQDLLKSTPPVFIANPTPPPIPKLQAQEKEVEAPIEKKSKLGRNILRFVGIVILVITGFAIFASVANNNSGSGQSYEARVMTVAEIENSQPENFLMASGNYNENFWGDKIKVHGLIRNNATVATYKDAVVRVTYYSKTKTELGSKEYTIYDVFRPHSEIPFELKIATYRDVNSIGWEVITASIN